MKKGISTTIALLLATWATGQITEGRRAFLTPAQTQHVATFDSWELRHYHSEQGLLQAPVLPPTSPAYSPAGKTALLDPVVMGQASNVFTCVTTSQNQVWADDAADLVFFVHRNYTDTWGGSTGHLRYDLSIDAGQSFTSDIGPINPVLTRVARYPNATGYNPTGSADPFASKLVYSAVTLDATNAFDGHVAGTSSITTSSPTTTENYLNIAQGSYLAGGLCQSVAGTFWSVDREQFTGNFTGRFFINRGTYDNTLQDVVWVRQDTVSPPHNTTIRPTGTLSNPNIAFSPDGQTGWVAWLGDLIGGQDSVLSPVLMQSTDGGNTWGTPFEVNLNSEPWVADSLRALWIDDVTFLPISSGRATCGFDFDLTVDLHGSPHFATVVGSGTTTNDPVGNYGIYDGLAKFLGDIWTPDGGATWDIAYIAPVLAFSGEFGQGANGTVRMDNHVQVSRNTTGSEIYYAWVDSDTMQTGFGNADQLAPNLRIAGRRPYQNMQTYPRLVTDGDLVWEGRALWPTLAPIVLNDGSCRQLPIVVAELLNNDGYSTTQFHYFGTEAVLCGLDFCDAEQMDLSWPNIVSGGGIPCITTRTEQPDGAPVVLHPSYPNPAVDAAIILFELDAPGTARLALHTLHGQELGTLAEAAYPAGAHRIDLDTRGLAAGIYFITLQAGGQVLTQKLLIHK